MNTVAFFNSKGGVGTTTLVYHLAHMFADRGLKVLCVDLDPQANLTSMCLDQEKLETIWESGEGTIYGAIRPLLEGNGDIAGIAPEHIKLGMSLIPGDLSLAKAEDELSSQWPDCLDRNARAFRVLSAIWRIMKRSAAETKVQLVLLDVGPNLGALNRAALIAANRVVVPVAPDIDSLQGLHHLGPTLRRWRAEWQERLPRNPVEGLSLPAGEMDPMGYVVMQQGLRDNRPFKAYKRWMDRIPQTYEQSVLQETDGVGKDVMHDPHCLALLKHYRSLMPMAMEAHKPMFHLKPADGAIGAHVAAVQACYQDFQTLAARIAAAAGVELK